MRMLKLCFAAALAAAPFTVARAQSPMTATPIPYANQDNFKDATSKARREVDRNREARADQARQARRARSAREGGKKPAAGRSGPDGV